MPFNQFGQFKSQEFSIDMLAELIATRSLLFGNLKDVEIPNIGSRERGACLFSQ